MDVPGRPVALTNELHAEIVAGSGGQRSFYVGGSRRGPRCLTVQSADSIEKLASARFRTRSIAAIAACASLRLSKTSALSRGPSVRVPHALDGASQQMLPSRIVALTTKGMH